MPSLFGEEFDLDILLKVLNSARAAFPKGAAELVSLPANQRRRLLRALDEFGAELARARAVADPTRQPRAVFDPSNPLDMAGLLGERLCQHEREPLEDLEPFYGSGVYALYYTGAHSAYRELCEADIPIYVGKVEPQTPGATNPMSQGPKLYDRLRNDHSRSIRNAERYASEHEGVEPIALADFEFRYLALPSTYAAAVERSLLNHYEPVWATSVCDGFGKHGDSASTRSNSRSEWDTLHPGRRWATHDMNTPNPKSPEEIRDEIQAHIARVRERLGV